MRLSDPQMMKLLNDAHLEVLRGGRVRPPQRRAPRTN
jgi:hypothetical protein